ncbi:hypothetical protein N8K70_11560 [Microbacterium betulae]|uniref:Uncharacterized protein n=1 Tax=Microbacterium betulae TaxID=2981139 RepID=A0AA97FF51_9MICO|nr:hypothetical protein [Microbacterium sp. AB]WOF22013.1 hypothetical protein N8K70_11560 [Microbacterium sp. AB]
MELTGLVLAAIGAADLVRRGVRGRRSRALGVAAVLLLCALAGAALGAGSWSSLLFATVPVAAAAGWIVTMRADGSRLGFLPLAGAAAIAVAAMLLRPARPDLVIPWGGDGELPVSLALLAVGGGLFLLDSANRVVRTALRFEDVPSDEETPTPRRRLFSGLVARDGPAPPPDGQAVHTLRGGRLIGPLERVVLAGLLLAQAYPVVAALIAAKGIVRFPEISRDRDRGTQAEYFLVGSMVSWALALAVTALVWFGAASV